MILLHPSLLRAIESKALLSFLYYDAKRIYFFSLEKNIYVYDIFSFLQQLVQGTSTVVHGIGTGLGYVGKGKLPFAFVLTP